MLKTENLCKSLNGKAVIKDLNLELPEETIFGLAGKNGAGKSTLLRMLAGIYRPDQGSVSLDGNDPFTFVKARSELVFVPDELNRIPCSTLEEMRKMYEAFYPFDNSRYHACLQTFGLEENMSAAGMSKGMKRRAAIVLAVSVHPHFLLLDEAYDGLDAEARTLLKKILFEVLGEDHSTIVISSHELLELEGLCDTFGILKEGKITCSGNLMVEKEKYHLYQLVYDIEKEEEDFSNLEVLSFEKEGRTCRMIIRGEEEEVNQKLSETHPLVLNERPLNFEEMVLNETVRKEKADA